MAVTPTTDRAVEVSGEPAMAFSNFIHGIERMPVRFTPRKAPRRDRA